LYWGELNDLCKLWLKTGKVPGSEAQLMLAPEAAAEGLSQAERQAIVSGALKTNLEAYAAQYKKWKLEVDALPSRLGEPPLWPSIWPALERSIRQLMTTFEVKEPEKSVKTV
jgi:hypothetical protein